MRSPWELEEASLNAIDVTVPSITQLRSGVSPTLTIDVDAGIRPIPLMVEFSAMAQTAATDLRALAARLLASAAAIEALAEE